MPADRYLITGGHVPRIYPGVLRGLADALKDAERDSRSRPGTDIVLYLITNGERRPLRVYRDGTCTVYNASRQQQEEE